MPSRGPVDASGWPRRTGAVGGQRRTRSRAAPGDVLVLAGGASGACLECCVCLSPRACGWPWARARKHPQERTGPGPLSKGRRPDRFGGKRRPGSPPATNGRGRRAEGGRRTLAPAGEYRIEGTWLAESGQEAKEGRFRRDTNWGERWGERESARPRRHLRFPNLSVERNII